MISSLAGGKPRTRTPAQIVADLEAKGLADDARYIASKYGVTLDDGGGLRAADHVVRARAHLYAALRGIGWSYPMIGTVLGRDHTTVLYALRARRRAA